MSIVGIREVTGLDEWTSSGDYFGDSITVSSWESQDPDAFFTGYNLSDQEISSTEFEYTPSSGFGAVETTKGVIDIRKGSGLIIIHSSNDSADIDQVFREARNSLKPEINVKKRFVPEVSTLWDFILFGHPQRIEVVTPFGGVQRVSFEENGSSGVSFNKAVSNYPVDSAIVKFESEEDSFDVNYFDGKLKIDSCSYEDIRIAVQAFETAISE